MPAKAVSKWIGYLALDLTGASAGRYWLGLICTARLVKNVWHGPPPPPQFQKNFGGSLLSWNKGHKHGSVATKTKPAERPCFQYEFLDIE